MVMLTDAANRQLAFRVKELEDVTKVMESTLNQQGVMLQRQEAINEILCNMVGISYAKVRRSTLKPVRELPWADLRNRSLLMPSQ